MTPMTLTTHTSYGWIGQHVGHSMHARVSCNSNFCENSAMYGLEPVSRRYWSSFVRNNGFQSGSTSGFLSSTHGRLSKPARYTWPSTYCLNWWSGGVSGKLWWNSPQRHTGPLKMRTKSWYSSSSDVLGRRGSHGTFCNIKWVAPEGKNTISGHWSSHFGLNGLGERKCTKFCCFGFYVEFPYNVASSTCKDQGWPSFIINKALFGTCVPFAYSSLARAGDNLLWFISEQICPRDGW